MRWFTRWEFFALASAFFAGLTAFLGKLGVMNVNSNLATLIRTFVVLVMTAGIISCRQQWQWPQGVAMKAWFFLVLSGIATGLSWLCYWRAMSIGPLAKVSSIDKLSLAFVVILGVLFLGEHLSWQVAVGVCLIIAGAVLIGK